MKLVTVTLFLAWYYLNIVNCTIPEFGLEESSHDIASPVELPATEADVSAPAGRYFTSANGCKSSKGAWHKSGETWTVGCKKCRCFRHREQCSSRACVAVPQARRWIKPQRKPSGCKKNGGRCLRIKQLKRGMCHGETTNNFTCRNKNKICCIDTDPGIIVDPTEPPMIITTPAPDENGSPSRPSRCNKPEGIGPCLMLMYSYYFNPNSGKCEMISFGGCRGNGNGYDKEHECIAACHGKNNGTKVAATPKPCPESNCDDCPPACGTLEIKINGCMTCQCYSLWGQIPDPCISVEPPSPSTEAPATPKPCPPESNCDHCPPGSDTFEEWINGCKTCQCTSWPWGGIMVDPTVPPYLRRTEAPGIMVDPTVPPYLRRTEAPGSKDYEYPNYEAEIPSITGSKDYEYPDYEAEIPSITDVIPPIPAEPGVIPLIPESRFKIKG